MPSAKPRNFLVTLLCVVFGFLLVAAPLFAASSEQVLNSFCYGSTCGGGGNTPYAGVIFDAAGNLYGTTSLGDGGRGGVVYELIPNNGQWRAKYLLGLNGKYGSESRSSLVLDTAGNLYGTATQGGAYNSGTVFELTPDNGKWTAKVLHSFKPNHRDGLNPYCSLILDRDGNLYGTTYYGGTHNSGTVFELVHSNGKWTHMVLHNFNGNNGANPVAGVILDTAGNLYGTTYQGGTYNSGIAFELMLDNSHWKEKVLHVFTGSMDRGLPVAGLTLGKNKNLYGTTYDGGAHSYGTVFELILDKGGWEEKVLHNFCTMTDCNDGLSPAAGLIFDNAGNLYGTTEDGGFWGGGTVFEVRP